VMTAAAQPGNSGGGVFVYRDGEWQLVGILVAGAQSGTLTFAVDLATIKQYLHS
jgi:S1-C subfamily serine protease